MQKTVACCLSLSLGLLVFQLHAQNISPAWKAYREGNETRPASEPPAPADVAPATPWPAASPAPVRRHVEDRDRGGFFVGVHGGRGWIYEDVDQDTFGASAGYRWQAGPYARVGVEATGGVLREARDDWYSYPRVRYAGVGANARINFGRSPWFAAARLGYFNAKGNENSAESIDGVYAGLGIGVDAGRHVSFSLAYTGFFYSSTYYYRTYDYSGYYTEINRADTVTLGVEVLF